MPQINITEEGVWKGLERLNPHNVAGPGKIGLLVLKELADVIAPVITRIFQASLNQGETPNSWKEAHVTPVFKRRMRNTWLSIINQCHSPLSCASRWSIYLPVTS